ncbi:integrase core domain protein [Paraburkholderia fungorum]|uniref:Integrase core domain protein n=1 Tax=Paraburkholderia fungorum TaxID=134537 RepID=A0AAU8TCD4_9BURK|nr:IS30 family transposase [Paraburkholderia fungorum]AJZ57895.1 integrase core domain protein [Paraburkholderia fungorum]
MGKKYEHLSAEERGVIFAMKLEDRTLSAIALALQRSRSTISRELRRNNWKPKHERGALGRPPVAGGYNATSAGRRAMQLRHKPRRERKLQPEGALWAEVRQHLDECHSPEQISAELKRTHPDEPALNASHETIYNAIYAMPRGELKRELVGLLRQGRSTRKPRTRGEDRRGKLVDMASIHIRPPEANERRIAGHWEGDLIKGAGNRSAVGTLIDRSTLFVMLVKMEDSTAEVALKAYSAAFAPLDPELLKTLTYDQGKEMALHKKLAETTGIKVYFCDPHSPWQRGICENTNGLLRQFLPKGADLSKFTQRELDAIALNLNRRPRKTLGWRRPGEVFIDNCARQGIVIDPVVALGI